MGVVRDRKLYMKRKQVWLKKTLFKLPEKPEQCDWIRFFKWRRWRPSASSPCTHNEETRSSFLTFVDDKCNLVQGTRPMLGSYHISTQITEELQNIQEKCPQWDRSLKDLIILACRASLVSVVKRSITSIFCSSLWDICIVWFMAYTAVYVT